MKKLFLSSQFSQVADKLVQLVPRPAGLKLAFITTAAEVYQAPRPWLLADRQKLVELGFEVEDFEIKGKNEKILYEELKKKDAVFVSGGNTFYLLYQVKLGGFDKAITRLVNQGIIYIGSSAGSILACPTIEPAKSMDKVDLASKLNSFEALGFINFVILPHAGTEKYSQRNQDAVREWSKRIKLTPITDNQVVIVEGDNVRLM